ncbi:hypothetical protein QBC34DRAFT_385965 [Podospora aff. communis PSN243]|uniref:Prolyl 4-hydroxylase alpha subunit domain-containing protein n=1 Tax=Podospora aff. communis PSN243 TaxID=3040156 RepID=A0AAV9G6M0_9PEZI|nr:hypothetical protein QBC34DRAFT_385965 [Podospora aff. communis PSN243]
MLLLSILRCYQFISEHGNPLNLVTKDQGTPSSTSLDLASYRCVHNYSIELLSVDPLAIYINNFIRNDEIDHVLHLVQDSFTPSLVTPNNSSSELSLNQTVRLSQTAFPPGDDPVAQCLMDRTRSLLGNVQHAHIETPQVVKYEAGADRFRAHTDWFDPPTRETVFNEDSAQPTVRRSNRLGSIFAYLVDDCTRGETFFPELPRVSLAADGDKFALPADDGGGGAANKGLLVRPRRGNAVFWNNLLADGSGDLRTVHAGLPVGDGTKVGLNIWSRYYFDLPMVGGEGE